MTMLLRVAERALNRPLLVHPDKIPIILGVLEGRIPLGEIADLRQRAQDNIDKMPADARAIMRGPSPGASRFVGSDIDEDPQSGKRRPLPYRRTKEGVAVITVTGTLINRGAWLGSDSGETSYEGIKFQVASAADDLRANSILLDIESPGGEAVGAFEAAESIRLAASKKPVIAVVNGMAASAAYALASGATKIITTPTGLSGSIGVVMLHADYSRHLNAKGITPTLIFAGAHKVDGNPFEPLPPGVRDDLQAEVDQYYQLFVKTVAAGRKRLTQGSIRDTEARTFIGADAVTAGLADSIGTFESVLAELSARATARRGSNVKGKTMADNQDTPAVEAAGISLQQHNGALEAAKTESKTAGLAEGKNLANKRFAAIMADEKTKGREKIALDLALKSPDMAAADVVEFVAGLPAGQSAPPLGQRMEQHNNNLQPGNEPRQSRKVASIDTNAIYAKRRQATAP